MAHVALPEGLPGISGGFAFRPETAKPMRELAHILLHEPGSLHGAAAAAHLGGDESVKQVKTDFQTAPVTPKLKALLAIAGKVQRGGKNVTAEDVAHARSLGATDLEIHDTVLIAAAFSMYNRYVDGLGTWQPEDQTMYATMGKHLAEHGYLKPSH
jgi:alkylhydroperoxidase/carboxymuconolactone decarboxylase family protein YurZ